MNNRSCTADFIAEIMNVSAKSIKKRAKKEEWKCLHRRTRGGFQKLYVFSALPDDIQAAIAAKNRQFGKLPAGECAAAGATCGRIYNNEAIITAAMKQKKREAGMIKFSELPAEKQHIAEARYQVLKARDGFISASNMPVKRGSKVFCKEVAAGRITLPDGVKSALTRKGKFKLSWETLNRWRQAFDDQGLYGLAPKYSTYQESFDGVRTSISEAMQEFIIGMKVDKPHVSLPKIMKGLAARFDGQAIPHRTTVSRFLSRWEAENKSLLLYCSNPDEWKNRHLFALGSADEAIERLNQLWEMDSTPGDVMLKDGRHTVIGCIDIYTRRLKLLVSKTSNSTAIAALIRNCLLDWGVPEAIKTDNGTDYVSNHIVRVLGSLEIEQRLCRHFSPEEKPFIERALGTFSHDICELLPGYVGHSVADRKAIEARRSFAQRFMKQGEVVEINMTAAEFQKICDRWVNAMYHQDPHSGLNGKSPSQVAREWKHPIRKIENERALDLLLYPAPDSDGFRVISKKGVQVGNIYYMSDEFIGHEGHRVQVLLDPSDMGTVYCYLESGQFLCRAIEPAFHGLDRAEFATHLKNKQKQIMNEGRRELKKIANKVDAKSVYREVLEYRERRIENLTDFPHRSESYTTDALDEAARAVSGIARDAAGPQPIDITPEQEVVANEIISLESRRPKTPLFANDWEKYEFYSSALRDGEDVPDEILAWMKRFEISLEEDAAWNGFN